jgi:hypothetical protein
MEDAWDCGVGHMVDTSNRSFVDFDKVEPSLERRSRRS